MKLTAIIEAEGDGYVSLCPELDIASQGDSIEHARDNLREALELATHVALMVRGKLGYQGERTAEMLADPGWLYAQHGES